jgi:hypothetical protein
LAWARLTSVSEQTWGPISDELVLALRANFTGDEATLNAAFTLVTVAANLGELELIARSHGGDAPRWLLTDRH